MNMGKTYNCNKNIYIKTFKLISIVIIKLGGEQIISPLKSSTKNDCISSSVARVAKFCVTNKSMIIFD